VRAQSGRLAEGHLLEDLHLGQVRPEALTRDELPEDDAYREDVGLLAEAGLMMASTLREETSARRSSIRCVDGAMI
jgi:hypothetical protein